uniref:LTD domain-containing protein n=1 Tax=Sphingobacterium sp. (strain 21) TaxID=743722 RepID=F4CD36_SPHS2
MNKICLILASSLLSLLTATLHAQVEPLDILINEILPDPKAGGVEFVEVYNRSEKTIDLKSLQIARVIDKDSLINVRPLATKETPFYPKQYMVLSKDGNIVKDHYYTENPTAFIDIAAMPQLPNTGGSIAIISGQTIIDRLDYHEGMHHPLVKNPKGVSLERQSFEEDTNKPGNFTSAAASVGYATPGYRNSQQRTEQHDAIWLSSKTFSPDYDGFEDLLQINYRFQQSGNMVNVYLYNEQGMLVKTLYRNHLLGTSGTLFWDGVSDTGQRLPVGIYLVYVEVYNSIDGIKKYRMSCVLTTKF